MSTAHLAVFVATWLSAAPDAAPPWGKAESPEEKQALEKTALCTDGKSHYVAVAPDPKQLTRLFYGDGKRFFAVPRPPWVLTGSEFLEPRFLSSGMNPSFRGVDLRTYGGVAYDAATKKCTARCGERNTDLQVVEPEKASALLLAATYEASPQQYAPHALLRDETGRYYYVDRGFTSDKEKSFRLFVGPKGSLKLQKMTNVVTDSEGQIFSTKSGELRMVIDRVGPAVWIAKGTKTQLREVPIEANLQLIYNDLGVYTGVRLGTPCDDL